MEKDIAFLENEIVEVLAKIEKANYDHHEHKKEFGGEYQYMVDLYDEEIIHWMRRLYRCICVYLELKGLSNILHEFQMEFGSVTNNRLKILERINSVDDEYSYAPPLLMLDDFRMYIRPFEAFSYSAEKSKAIDALHNVLKETPRILKKHKIAITTETDVSKEVRWVLDLYFDTRATNSRFIKKHQNYKPDTLIPLLGVAIEFKLVREKAKVAIYLDQLIVDATNYTDDPHYTNFIAVLCLQDSTITEKSVLEAWKEKKFPNNWKLIIVYI